MKADKTITLTLTEEEFRDMRVALSEASSSWFDLYQAKDFDINSGERLVYDARCRLRDKFAELYNKHSFRDCVHSQTNRKTTFVP